MTNIFLEGKGIYEKPKNVKYVANSFLDTEPKELPIMERNTKNARIVMNCSVEENTREESMKSEKSKECKKCHFILYKLEPINALILVYESAPF